MMAAEEGLPVVTSEEISGNSEFSGCALLVVIGEPFSDDHKELIVERLTKALQSWDAASSGLDVNTELEAIAQAAPSGTEGANGERVIEHYSDLLHTDILINPEIHTFTKKLRIFLKKNVTYRHLVYSGHYFHGSGNWILQDDRFSFSKFLALFKEPDIDVAVKKQTDKILALNVFGEGDWVPSNLAKHSFGKILEVRINPGTKLESITGVLQFSAYLSYIVNPVPVKELLKASDVVGNIRFSRPTLYIFPGFQGDSALFGISGFNLLVNGGYGRKACFWDFTRHLDRIDALLLSHLSEDNLFGASAVLARKAQENVHPEIGYVYFNAFDEKQKGSPNGDVHPEDGGSHKPASLSVDLIQEGNKMVENIKCINQDPHPCLGRNLGTTLQPINLYLKVGHGSLDMYVLNPLQDNKEMKEFLAQWSKHASTFSSKNGIPLPHLLSVAALLVWKPSSPSEKITRILFPGSVPQAKLFDGMDKLKTIEMFKHAECSEESLKAPQVAKVKKTTASRMGPVPKQPASPSVGRTVKKEKDTAEAKDTSLAEKRKPIAKPDGAKGKVTPRKADKKTTTKSAADSDTKSTSSVETPPPSLEEVVSPAESGGTAVSAVLAVSETSATEVKETQEIPELVQVEPLEKVNGTAEIVTEAVPDTGSNKSEISDASPCAEKFVEEECAKESPVQSSEPAESPVIEVPEVIQMNPVADANQVGEESLVGASMVESQYAPSPVQQVDEDNIVEKLQSPESQLDENIVFESPDALPEPELLKDQSIHAKDEVEPPYTHSTKDDEKDIDTTEINVEQQSEALSEKFMPGENKESYDNQENLPSLIDISPSEEQVVQEKPATPSDVRFDIHTETRGHAEMKGIDENVMESDSASHSGSLVSPGTDQQSEIISPMECKESSLIADMQQDNSTSDPSPVQADYQFDQISDGSQNDDVAKPDSSLLDFENGPTEKVCESENGVTAEEQEPFNGAKPEGLPLPQEPEFGVAEPFELDEDMVKLSEQMPSDTSDHLEAKSDEFDVGNNPRVEEHQFDQCVDDMVNIGGKDMKLTEETGDMNVDINVMTDDVSPTKELSTFEADSRASLDDNSLVTDINEPELVRDSEVEIPDHFTSEDISTTDIMKDSIDHSIDNPFTEEDSLNVSKDSLLDGDQVAETVTSEKFDAISDSPKDIPVPECDLSSPTNPFMGMSPSEPAESQVANENGEYIPFAAETPPSESIAEPDSLMEDVPNMQQELPYDLLGQMQQVNASLVDFSQNDDEQFHQESENNLTNDDAVEEFDPLKEWGQPMGLPAPTPDSDKAAAKSPRTTGKTTARSKRDEPTKSGSRLGSAPTERKPAVGKESADKKTTSRTKVGAKKPASAPPRSSTSKVTEPKAETARKPAITKQDDTKKAAPATSKRMSMGVGRRAAQPTKEEQTKDEKKPASKLTTSKRPATSSSATKVTAPPVKLLPVVPFYVDLTYIPHHGDSDYVNINYFRRVRARYYVYSALQPDEVVLQSLLDAKQTWDDPNLEVTVIPTYDTEELRLWFTQNRDKLASLKVDIAPSASRCTIQLQDHETSCAAYRLEF